jgi:signal transduction histidine kinase
VRLRQILWNLVQNALKFTPEGYVGVFVDLVALSRDRDFGSGSTSATRVPHLLFRVLDTGKGLDSATLMSLFQRFYQGQRSYTQPVCSGRPRVGRTSFFK